MPAEHENVVLYFGSRRFGAPDCLQDPILRSLSGARKSLAVATQQLTARDVITALVAARRRGVVVRVFLERDYLRESHPLFDIWKEHGLHETHRRALSTLYRSNVDVRVDTRSRIMHNNFIIVDAGEQDAVVISTSANLTPTGLQWNFEHLVILRESSVIKAFQNKFEALWSDQLGPADRKPPPSFRKGVKILFEPEHDIEGQLVEEVTKATRSVTFSVGSLSKGSKIDDALIGASREGIRVFGVLDGQQAQHRWTAADTLGRSGAMVWLTEEMFPAKLHHKLALIDDKTMCVGTFNFSVSAASRNEEVMIILNLGNEAARFLQYARHEIDRIAKAFSVSSMRLLGG